MATNTLANLIKFKKENCVIVRAIRKVRIVIHNRLIMRIIRVGFRGGCLLRMKVGKLRKWKKMF